MKKITLLTLLTVSVCVYSQVGIETANPQGVFHVDPLKNNPVVLPPDASQSADDFIVDNSGNTGIGTVTPVQKLQIIGDDVKHPIVLTNSPNLASGIHLEQLAIDDSGNVGVKSSVGTIASVFTIQSEVRGLNMSSGSSNVNIPLSSDQMIYNTLSSTLGTDTVSGIQHSYITIPVTGAYEIQVLGAFNCSTAGIWGMNLQMRKGIDTNGTVNYTVIETRRLASTFSPTTEALPGRVFGEYLFNAGDRINFRLAAGKTYTSVTAPNCGSVNISGPTSGIKIIIAKVD